jgi:hypothetical protein
MDLSQYNYLQAGFRDTLVQIRGQIATAYADASEESKPLLSDAYAALELIANGANHAARWQALGSTGQSITTPLAPEITTMQGLE